MADDALAERRLQEETWQAERAAQLMADPIMKHILEETERVLILTVKNATTPEQAFKAAIALQTFSVIVNSMQAMVNTGKMASMELERRRSWFGKLGY